MESENFKTSEELGEIFSALAKAQGVMRNPKKNEKNSFFNSKYSDLSEVIKVISGPLSENDLTISQYITGDKLTTLLGHKSGQFISCTKNILLEKKTAHGEGSGITYSRRYQYLSILGLAPEDDDGNQASGLNKNLDDPFRKLVTTNSLKHLEFTWKKYSVSWKSDKDFQFLLMLKDLMKKHHSENFDINDFKTDKLKGEGYAK